MDIKSIVYWATGLMAFVILTFTVVFWCNSHASLPKPPKLSDSQVVAEQDIKVKEIANYQTLATAIQAQNTVMYERSVKDILLPIFNTLIAAVLGYVFARAGLQFYTAYLSEKSERRRLERDSEKKGQ